MMTAIEPAMAVLTPNGRASAQNTMSGANSPATKRSAPRIFVLSILGTPSATSAVAADDSVSQSYLPSSSPTRPENGAAVSSYSGRSGRSLFAARPDSSVARRAASAGASPARNAPFTSFALPPACLSALLSVFLAAPFTGCSLIVFLLSAVATRSVGDFVLLSARDIASNGFALFSAGVFRLAPDVRCGGGAFRFRAPGLVGRVVHA